jgi:GNAT superfamily N-acetyltransferase
VAYQDPQHGGAELASLYVEPVHRHQGIGRRLLEHLEAQVTRQGFPFIQVRYRSTIPQIDAFEHLLERRAWGPATVSQHMFKAPLEDVLTAPWIDRYPLPAAAAPVAWTDLTPEEAAAIKRRKGQPEPEGYPAALDPFQLAHLPWQPYSLGLRTPDGVAGWMMAHRLSESLVQYTSLWIHPSLRGSGASVYLVGEALKRQQREGQAPDCLWRVDADNDAMLRFTRRRLSPYLSHAAETLLRGKSLQAPTSHII